MANQSRHYCAPLRRDNQDRISHFKLKLTIWQNCGAIRSNSQPKLLSRSTGKLAAASGESSITSSMGRENSSADFISSQPYYASTCENTRRIATSHMVYTCKRRRQGPLVQLALSNAHRRRTACRTCTTDAKKDYGIND